MKEISASKTLYCSNNSEALVPAVKTVGPLSTLVAGKYECRPASHADINDWQDDIV